MNGRTTAPPAETGAERLRRVVEAAPLHWILLALAVLVPAAMALYHDPFRLFVATPDADIVYVHEALRLNEGLPQHKVAHPGYSYFVLLSWWFLLLKAVGLVPIARLGELPSGEAFYSVYATLVYAGRFLAPLLSGAFVVVFYFTARTLAGRAPALLAAALVASSVAVIHHALLLRTETTAATLALLAFLLFLLAARARPDRAAVLIAAAGAAVMLAMGAKIQVVFHFMGFTGLLLLFGTPRDPAGPALGGRAAAAWVAAGLVLAVPAGDLALSALFDPDSYWGPRSGAYQAALAVGVAIAMILYARLYGVSRTLLVAAAGALLAGLSVGLLLLVVYENPRVIEAVVKFAEHMRVQGRDLESGYSLFGMLGFVIGQFDDALARRFIPGSLDGVGMAVLYWAAALCVALNLRARAWLTAARVAGLLGFAVLLDMVFALRSPFERYLIFVTPWIVLALVVGVPPLLDGARRLVAPVLIAAAAVLALQVHAGLQPHRVQWQPANEACAETSILIDAVRIPFQRYCDD